MIFVRNRPLHEFCISNSLKLATGYMNNYLWTYIYVADVRYYIIMYMAFSHREILSVMGALTCGHQVMQGAIMQARVLY